MKILIDIDSTIINSIEMLVNIYNKKNNMGMKLIYTKDHDWDLNPIVKNKKQLKELFSYFDDKDFYENPIFIYGCRGIINKLSKDNTICFCSKHKNSRKPITECFIRKYFPNCSVIFVDDFKEKTKISADLIIDDKPESLVNSKATYKICFGDYQWNKDWQGTRCIDWDEIYDLIKIFKIIEGED